MIHYDDSLTKPSFGMGTPLISSVHGSHSNPCFATTSYLKSPENSTKTQKKHLYRNTPPDFSVSTPFFLDTEPPSPPKKNITPYPSYPDIFNFHGKYLEPSCTSVGSGAAFWSFTWLNRGEEIPTTKVPPAEVVVGMTPSCS